VFVSAGLQAIFAAADFFTVDRTPPLAGHVRDGPMVGMDDSYVGTDRNYCVNWAGFSDPESGLGPITWTVGEWRTRDFWRLESPDSLKLLHLFSLFLNSLFPRIRFN